MEPSENVPLDSPARAPLSMLGRFRIVDEIARGGMGIVYKAIDPDLQRPVALKVLREVKSSEKALERFRREAEAVARLRHPNIVGVHEIGESQGFHFMVMDYIDGEPLDTMLERGAERTGLLRILAQVADAAHYAHAQGIVHRDLKPANIIVDRTDRPVVSDFGLAKILGGESRLTQTGQAIGTPLYMSPEQVSGRPEDVDARTDIFSLGVILYEAVTGAVPFLAETAKEIYRKISQDDPAPPRSIDGAISGDLETVILKAMEKEPRHRYATAGAFAEDLRRVLENEPILAKPSGLLTRAGKRLRRSPGVAAMAAVSLLAIVAASAIAMRQWIRRGSAEKRAAEERAALERRAAQEREAQARAADRKNDAVRFFQAGVNALAKAEDRYRYPGEKPAHVNGDLETAVGMFSKAIETFGEYAEAFHYRGRARLMLYRIQGKVSDYDSGLKDFDEAIRLNGKYTTAYFDRARLNVARYVSIRGTADLRHAGPVLVIGKLPPESDEARSYRRRIEDDIERLERLSPLPDESRFAKVALAYAQSRFEEAIAAAGEALEGSPLADEIYVMRGEAHLRRGEAAEAVTDLENATRRRPNDPRIRRLKAHARFLTSDFAGATADYAKVVELWPDAPAYVSLARAHGWQGDVDAAARALEEAEKIDAAYPELYSVRALVHLRRGQTKEMLEDIDKAIELAPREAFFHCNRGDLYQMIGKLKEALPNYQKALELDPDLWLAHVNRGSARFAMNDFAGAAEDATEALKQEPRSPDALFNRGNALLMLMKYDEALDDYTNAIRLRPRVPEMYYYRGVTHNRKGELPIAVEDFTQAIEISVGRWSEEWKAWYSRGQDEFELQRYKECVRDLEKACAMNPALREKLSTKIEEARKKSSP